MAGSGKSADEPVAVKVPLCDVRQITDDEWNRLAYRNYLERRCANESKEAKGVSDGKEN